MADEKVAQAPSTKRRREHFNVAYGPFDVPGSHRALAKNRFFWCFLQEYGCAFMDASDAVFRKSDLEAAYSHDIEELDMEVFDEWTS